MATNAPDALAPAARVPLYRTIADAIIRDIRRGRHLEGERLPASRDLARSLEVNRATVHQALQLLKREGWIETNKGGGTRVARRSSAGPVLGPAPAWDRIASSLLLRIVSEPHAAEPAGAVYDLSRLAPDERDFPAAAFAALLAEVARDGALLAYGSPFGYRPLRESLAERLRRRGIPAEADGILIVNGAQQGLDLITRALVDPGDPVAVEVPSYSLALSLFRAHRARLLGVPLDLEGPEPGALAQALAERPKFLYTIPDFHNPTGLLSSPRRRADLVEKAAAAGVLVVEDAFDADLLVEGELPPPLAALAPAHVVHLGTLSKALFPGLRVGWISAPREFVHRLAALKRVGELTSPLVLQAAVNLFLARGGYDRHLARTRTRLKGRLALAHRVIRDRFPVGTRCERPSGGWVLWIELPPGVPGRALSAAAREKGVLVSAGAEFLPDQADVPALRVTVARGSAGDLERALTVVGGCARSLAQKAARRSP
ncbi:MAG TPA: PLP-dependent aminotransferase family protein, partial [Thermoanaerobaculia bacterium]|nr:PLP-dependent aminotransferase family protein [Thermoanaerobaculia bacterium]